MKIQLPEPFEFLFQPARYKVAHGGRGSGKSRSFASALISIAATHQKERVLCAREIQNSIKDSVKRVLDDEIDRLGLNSIFKSTHTSIECTLTGSEFLFAGLWNNVDSIKSMEGITRVWIEEAHTISQESLDILIPTIRAPGSEIWFSFNAKLEDDPVYQMFVANPPPPNSIVKKVNYNQNPWFPDVLRTEMEWTRQNNPDKFRHVWEGFPVQHSDEQVFYGCWRTEDFGEPPMGTALYFGADFGFSQDPSTLVRCWLNGRNLYIDYEAYGHGVEIDDLHKLYDVVPGSRDWRIIGDSARPETISYVRRQGYNMEPSRKGKGSIEDGLEFLKSHKIIIHPRCKHTIDEFMLYRYKKDPKTDAIMPIIVDANNHIIDALRYACEDLMKGQVFIA